jgi:hypothetical protein
MNGVDLPLARRIWRRYGNPPGVIPATIVQDLARRHNRFGAGTLGLAADIQRRWLPAPAGGWRPALPLRWPAVAEAGIALPPAG